MADTPTYIIKGNGDILWGADVANPLIGGTAQAIGYLQSASKSENTDRRQIKNGTGDVKADVLYNENGELDCEFVLFDEATEPSKGDTLSIDGKVGHIISANKNFANEDAVKYSIKAAWYKGISYT